MVLMEALALGKPVITTRIAAHAELVDETVGRLVNAGDIDSLVDAMHELSDPLVRLPLSVNVRHRVWEDHDMAIEAEKFGRMLLELPERKKLKSGELPANGPIPNHIATLSHS